MLNNSVVSFCDTLGLIFKGSEDNATNGAESWPLRLYRCRRVHRWPMTFQTDKYI